MRIGVIEILYHHVFLYSLASIAKESGEDVTIFTTKELYNLVTPLFKDRVKNYKWVIKGENENVISFLKRVEKISAKELDLLFVNTIQGFWCIPAAFFTPRCRAILVAARSQEWFGNRLRFYIPHTKNSLIDLFRQNLSYIMRKKILPKYDGVVVHTESFKKYIQRYRYKKPIFVIPFAICECDSLVKKDFRKINFIVVGGIEEHRRDYDVLLKAFRKLWLSPYRERISLTLIGRPVGEYGKMVIKECKELKEKGYAIKFFEGYIPETVFMEEVKKGDILISPIKLENYPCGGTTSAVVEAIRNAKPGIYPKGYAVQEEVLSSSLFYDGDEGLVDLIENRLVKESKGMEELCKNAVLNSEKFSLNRMAKYFQEYIIKGLN
ncbi:MAG: glycosyltransferase [bacterium]|nr:glycosyltransferase [bacterium]